MIINHHSSQPKIALVIDSYGWAFHNIARQIKYFLSSSFQIDIFTLNELATIHKVNHDAPSNAANYGSFNALGRLLLISYNYDLIHFFYKEMFSSISYGHDVSALSYYASGFGLSVDHLIHKARISTAFTSAIYDHGASSSESLSVRSQSFRKLIDSYTVSSNKLNSIYSSHPDMPSPLMTIPDGVDFTKFFPIRLSRFAELPSRELVVGWAGNSKWGDGTIDHKGYWTILKPAIEQLQQKGYRVRLEIQDRNERHVALEDMVYYYAKLDAYVCVSDAEGTPNPVLEAMACGVPVISTDVGIVGEALGPLQHEFILPERSIHALQRSLINLLNAPSTLSALSGENLKSILPWSWKIQTSKFRAFFSQVLAEKASRSVVR